jgi:hypothetical protein
MKGAGIIVAAGFIGFAGAALADTWTRGGDERSYPIKRTTHEAWKFSPAGQVEVEGIGGSVEVSAGGPAVDFSYERRAATEQDYACETLRYEHTADSLRIWVERSRERACESIRASDKLVLSVPPGAAVSLKEIGDSVKVTGVEGRLRLASIGDSAVLSGVQQLEAKSIGDSLTLAVARLGAGGISIKSVGDSVNLSLPKVLDAHLRISGVGDDIRGPGVHIRSGDGDYEAVLGKGGPNISISGVGDSVVIRSGTEP